MRHGSEASLLSVPCSQSPPKNNVEKAAPNIDKVVQIMQSMEDSFHGRSRRPDEVISLCNWNHVMMGRQS